MKKILSSIIAFMIVFTGNSQILKKQIPDKLVVFTFDDAPASHYSIVAPLLEKYGFGATFSINHLKINLNLLSFQMYSMFYKSQRFYSYGRNSTNQA